MTEHNPTGFGETLRRRREQRGLSLNDVSVRTRVRKAYLQALEEENLTVLPGSAYAIGFLRIYARYLDLAAEPLIAALNGQSVPADESAAGDEGGTAVQRGNLLSGKTRGKKARGKKTWWLLLFVALILAGGGYLYMQSQPDAPQQHLPAPRPVDLQPPPVPVPTLPPPLTPPPASETPAAAAVDMVEMPLLPPQGAVVRIVAAGAGVIKVSLDGQESRSYELQPEQQLNWKVGSQLQVELSAPALIRCWIDEQEIPLAEHVAVNLVRASVKEPRQ